MRLKLPKDKPSLVRAMNVMLGDGIQDRNAEQTKWYITELYLRGVRQFSFLNYETGEVDFSWEDMSDEWGEEFYSGVPFRWERALTAVQKEIGRLSALDTRPRISKKAYSLQSLKDAALAQAVVDQMISREDPRVLRDGLIQMLVMYGTCGLARWDLNKIKLGFNSHRSELIPPWEMVGVPSTQNNPTDKRAIIRYRVVPLSALKDNPDFPFTEKDHANMHVVELPYGQGPVLGTAGGALDGAVHTSATTITDIYGGEAYDGLAKGKKQQGDVELFVELQEVFVEGDRGTISEYAAKAGQHIFTHRTFEDEDIPFPISVARYIDTGQFYGRSFAWTIIPFAQRMERLLKNVITNVEDMDRFGYICAPMDMGLSEEDFKYTGGPRVLWYRRDPMSDKNPIDAIQPINSSTLPAEVVNYMSGELAQDTAQGPLFDGNAPGRVESGVGIDGVSQLSATHLRMTSKSIAEAYTGFYRSMLYRGKQVVDSGSEEFADLLRIDNNMAGLTIDPEKGQIVLKGEKLPDPWRVEIGIQSDDPDGPERERREALEMLDRGQYDPIAFAVDNYLKGWNYPLGAEDQYENYVKAVLGNLILFNDGIVPGSIQENHEVDNPVVMALAMERFMRGTGFLVASPDVQSQFVRRYKDIKGQLGIEVPVGLESPDNAAAQQQALEEQAAQQSQGGLV